MKKPWGQSNKQPCKISDISLDSTSGIFIDKFSDHQPYFTVLNSIDTYEAPPVLVDIKKQDKDSISQFESEIITQLAKTNLLTETHGDPNDSYNILHDIIHNRIPTIQFPYNWF